MIRTALVNLHLILCPVVLCTGCGGEKMPTPAEALDMQVDESWREGRKAISAIEFLEAGGIYESTPQHGNIDRDHVLPLIRRLRDECGLEMEALLDTPEIAFAIVADVSAAGDRRRDIIAAIQEADDAFPGVILDNWGNQWLSLDLLDEQEAAALAEAGELELLKQHVAANRDTQRTAGDAKP